MDELGLEMLQKNPHWASILGAYYQLSVDQKAQSSESDGWIPRIQRFADLSNDALPGIHGKLIAFGFLKFDLAGRDQGLRYQLTPFGRQVMNPVAVVSDE